MEITYQCQRCGNKGLGAVYDFLCECGGEIRGKGFPTISTLDTFGLNNTFTDEKTGKTIDSWKKWENAGFRDPLETTKNHKVREMIKEKKKELKGQRLRQPKPYEMLV